ncbi:MAG: hypothetical protein K1X74_05860 [Pirellulales bacterium]|nr:hypothetical protein [Pirellulales bacterium]
MTDVSLVRQLISAFVPATAGRSDNPTLERVRINIRWLLALRWAAGVGQLVTIGVVRCWLGIELPLAELAGIIAIEFVTNAAFAWWFRRAVAVRSWEQTHVLAQRLLGLVMMLDILLLTGLLYLTGGPENPFCIFYLVNISLAAVVLKPRWTLWLAALAVVCFTTLLNFHRPLPALATIWLPDAAATHDDDHKAQLVRTQGLWFALSGAALFLVYFITRATAELARRESELSTEQQRRAQSQKLEALATLAAGAAHELASPLSTIAVVARELELQLVRDGVAEPTVQDAQLIRREVGRCREILDLMANRAGESVGEKILTLSLAELIERTFDGLREPERVEVDISSAARERRLHVPQHALAQSLRVVLRNALDASPNAGRVRLSAEPLGKMVRIVIRDSGTGMPPEILARAGEPFFTTKEPGQGMGLGLFITRRVIERLGGSLELSSVSGEGTTATITLPCER